MISSPEEAARIEKEADKSIARSIIKLSKLNKEHAKLQLQSGRSEREVDS